MTPEAYVKDLIPKGAVLSLLVPDNPEFLLAAFEWKADPLRFRWCAVFPEDQHHVHETEYATAEFVHGLYLVFKDSNGRIVAQVSGIQESGLDMSAAVETLRRWQDVLGRYKNQAQFERFFRDS